MSVTIHPVTKAKVKEDVCPKCGGALDTGWECNDCGYDAMWAVSQHDGQISRLVYWWPGQE